MQTTTGHVVPQTSTGGGDPKGEYYRLSAERCFMNNSCSCCTCHCCALCMMICWVIFGSIGAFTAYSYLELIGDDAWSTQACCILDGNEQPTDFCFDECCFGSEQTWNGQNGVYGATCDESETVYTISLIDNIR